jgi:hypothetical protein
MAQGQVSLPVRPFGQTSRRDFWWLTPALVFLGFSAFIIYSTWAAFQGRNYHFGPYLSPFYSPELISAEPSWWPGWLRFSPAFLILWAPGLFRFTCYYYRGAYYKAFWLDPPSCTVGEPRKTYRGESSLPLIIQNVHRYFLYLALIFIVLLAWDAVKATQFKDGFHIGVGTLVLTINVILLSSYTLGCHSLRHLIGGRLDQLSGAKVRYPAYRCVSCLNRKHMVWAWCSLFWVGFSDFYVRMCAMGVWTDWRIV